MAKFLPEVLVQTHDPLLGDGGVRKVLSEDVCHRSCT